MKTKLGGSELKDLFRGGKAFLNINRTYVDNLNVFPVPDGDTGTNMSLTLNSAVKEMEGVSDDGITEIVTALAKGALKGARGNSGVILSQILKGMTSVLETVGQINTKIFAESLRAGALKAYAAVVNPKEGTILTVIRLMADYAVKIARRTSDFSDFFDKILKRGEEVLQETPKLLPVLAKAGVVDSGGQGLLFIFRGMANKLNGVEMDDSVTFEKEQPAPQIDVNDYENITFTYCTEFFIINLKKVTTLADIDKLRDKLVKIGDSVLVVGELDFVKVHVHTNTPNIALGYALQLGDLDNVKIENMREQYRKLHGDEKQREHSEVGVLSISVGEGFKQLFGEFGADVMEGGQTMNPSVDDIVNSVNKLNADVVYVLPNNKNIILACEQASALVTCKLVIVPTKNIMQGIAALTAFEPDGSEEDNIKHMKTALNDIVGVEITHAVKDVDADGFEIKTGDVIALSDKIIAKGDNVSDVAYGIITEKKDDICVVDLYYGVDTTPEEANALGQRLTDAMPDCDVRVLCGGQPHYNYFISMA